MWFLAKNKADRYRTSEQMSEELAEFLLLHRLKATASDLSKLVVDVMNDRAATARHAGRSDRVHSPNKSSNALELVAIELIGSAPPDFRKDGIEQSILRLLKSAGRSARSRMKNQGRDSGNLGIDQ